MVNVFGILEELILKINDYYRRRNKRPVFQLDDQSRFIIISQAPGKRVHETGIPWNDASGRKLRRWLGVTDAQFYNKSLFSIMPMDFCYPGKGAHGDLPPDPECAKKWHPEILKRMLNKPLKILIGTYAINHYLADDRKDSLAETVKHYRSYMPEYFPTPHPSPRNQNWLKNHAWFEAENIPFLQQFIQEKIKETS